MAAQDPVTITSVAQIHQVSPQGLGKGIAIDMECIVLCHEPDWPILFVSDGKDGMYAGNTFELQAQAGDRVRLRGTLGPLRFPVGVTLEPSDNDVQFPPVRQLTFGRLQLGQEDSQLVQIEGQLVGLDFDRNHSSLEMRSNEGGRYRALLHETRATQDQLRAMLGKHLQLRGVVGARFDEQDRWSGFQIWLSSLDDVEELENPGQPISLPITPIADLTAEKIAATRTSFFRTAGVATYQLSPTMILLEDQSGPLFVEIQKPQTIDLDESYDVMGCLDTSVVPPVFRTAILKQIEGKFAVKRLAHSQSIDALVAGDFSGQFVRTVGTFAGTFEHKGQQGFLLKAGDSLLPVFVEGGNLGQVNAGTNIAVEGIWIQQRSLVGFNIGSCALHARMNGIHVGAQTPWLLLSGLGLVSTASLVLIGWAATLRKQVHRRTQQFLDSVREQRRTEEQYANFFIHARVMVMTTDQAGHLIAVNHAALKRTKRSEPSLLGQHVTELVTEPSKKILQQLLQSALSAEKTSICHVCLIDGSETGMPHEVSCWSTSQDGASHLHLIWHDISDRLRMQEQRAEMEQRLMSMQKMESLGVLAGGIAHDFNNLLTVIVGNSAVLSMSERLLDEDKQSLDSIKQASARAAELTQQMLAYAGRGRFDVGVLDLSNLVTEISQLLTAAIAKTINLRFDLQSDLPGVEGDATQLRQILMNLVRNAAESMPSQQGTIRVRTFLTKQLPEDNASSYCLNFMEQAAGDSPGFVCLEVCDQGVGIEPATLGKIFDPFYTTKFSGRGLGLSLVCGIVRGHNGYLEVNSQPGQGSTFRIYLRACEESITMIPAPHLSTGKSTCPAHVLVVDDETEVLAALTKLLRFAGLSATGCLGGQQALDALSASERKVDCIITDQTMPNMSGLQLCESIHCSHPDLPVILVSGYSVDLAHSKQKAPNIKAFLQKPYNTAELIRTIQALVEPSKLQAAVTITRDAKAKA